VWVLLGSPDFEAYNLLTNGSQPASHRGRGSLDRRAFGLTLDKSLIARRVTPFHTPR